MRAFFYTLAVLLSLAGVVHAIAGRPEAAGIWMILSFLHMREGDRR